MPSGGREWCVQTHSALWRGGTHSTPAKRLFTTREQTSTDLVILDGEKENNLNRRILNHFLRHFCQEFLFFFTGCSLGCALACHALSLSMVLNTARHVSFSWDVEEGKALLQPFYSHLFIQREYRDNCRR